MDSKRDDRPAMAPERERMPAAAARTEGARMVEEQRAIERKEQEAMNRRLRREAEKPNPDAMKLWKLTPIDVNEEPFHFSSASNEFLVVAESEEMARRFAVSHPEGGGDVWNDPDKVDCEEWKPDGPGVISRKHA